MLVKAIKRYYQKPFRCETESGVSLFLYKIISRLLGWIYTVLNCRAIYHSYFRLASYRKAIAKDGKSVFVFANGPSLKDIDLGKVNKIVAGGAFDLISVNSFLSKSHSEILPTFAVFADNLHFDIEGKDNQYKRDVDVCNDNLIPYFVPLHRFRFGSKLQIGYNGFCDIFSKNTTNTLTPPGFYGVTALHALRIAKYLGYKNIYLCGFDNSYFKDYEVTEDSQMVIRHRHYYDADSNCTDVPCIYGSTSEFFFDVYRHFRYIEKIVSNDERFSNIATLTYLSTIKRDMSLDVYKDDFFNSKVLK